MKKFISVLCLIVLLFAFCACSNNSESDNNSDEDESGASNIFHMSTGLKIYEDDKTLVANIYTTSYHTGESQITLTANKTYIFNPYLLGNKGHTIYQDWSIIFEYDENYIQISYDESEGDSWYNMFYFYGSAATEGTRFYVDFPDDAWTVIDPLEIEIILV